MLPNIGARPLPYSALQRAPPAHGEPFTSQLARQTAPGPGTVGTQTAPDPHTRETGDDAGAGLSQGDPTVAWPARVFIGTH